MFESATMIFNIAVFALTAFLAVLLTPFFIRLAHHYDFLDYPEGRKEHVKPMPYLGGAAILSAFLIVVLPGLGFLFLFYKKVGLVDTSSFHLFIDSWDGILAGALFIFTLGFLDDRFDLPPWIKLIGQGIAAFILIHSGANINLLAGLGWLGYVVTFVWLLLIMNAFNFIDSIDGHCAGISLISCFIFFCLSLIVYQPFLAFYVMALGGALAGFLPYNMKPARIFLGDCGSLFLGYMMAAITLLCTYRTSASPAGVTPFIPILMFGVPIYDTVSVIVVRLFRGIPPWKGDRNHFAHRLSRLGMNEKVAALFSYFIALTLGLVAVLSTQVTTFLGNFLVIMLFLSIISIVAFLEYYVARQIRYMEMLAEKKTHSYEGQVPDDPDAEN